jgi:hypothetical protein
MRSRYRVTIRRTSGSRCATRFGLKAVHVDLRMRVCTGGSAFDIVGLVLSPVRRISTTSGPRGVIGFCALPAEKDSGSAKIALMSS